MKKRILSTIAGVVAAVTLLASPAFAWSFGVSGVGQCQSDGSYKITWTVDNTNENEALTISSSSNTSVVPLNTSIAGKSTQTFTQTVSGTTTGSFTLSLGGSYPSDKTVVNAQNTVTLSQPCTQPGGTGGGDTSSVTLCHATASNTNPYVQITVDSDGAYNGHYTQHQGGIYPAANWGDIIPPFTYQGHSYSLNWTAGQAIYNNGCNVPTTGGMGGGQTTPPTTTTTTVTTNTTGTTQQVGGLGGGEVATTTAPTAATTSTTTPTGGVGAGEGGGSKVASVSAVVGLMGSLSALGLGVRRLQLN